ncbi:glycosyltransferase family 2 protein [Pontibacter fetidus]|uniref:Glycosyltransferase family 2 protein n=1 Tax=Pontibacter fetidus TaxID=2700082 RepID=A0A6B2H6A4_9BACT|nr:glycosyltransferase family 2 protein [Pontibacter fetidus]NDK56316.1 glycosyltransferase family 2 protein [Pontibacter fetidus]
MKDLAIVIPAYKAKYLHDCLNSISEQTCKNFTVYIGDDNSPENLKSIVDGFNNRIDLIYYKFEENLGSYSLVKHWARSISLTIGEKWLWLFSDDDLMSKNCVESFYNSLVTNPDSNLFRFNLRKIDKDGREIGELIHYTDETGWEYASAYVAGKRFSTVVEYIFSKSTYNNCNGFVEFPAAWGSDIASWINFSKESKIVTIPNGQIYWRLSGTNISSNSGFFRNEKFQADYLFALWLNSISQKYSLSFKVTNWYLNRLRLSEMRLSLIKSLTHSFKLATGFKQNLLLIFLYTYFFKNSIGIKVRLRIDKILYPNSMTTCLKKFYL